ncbi:MAG: hypothetical protein B7X11_01075 [Acidobacteria bacterium 37-65-4]|nr:MAG: hypothetical protein B7X11_01075 [Acidobacteria bacterium 37-65-4]
MRRGPALWLAALLAWAGLDAALRPVAVYDAARVLGAGLVALALLLVAARPRAAAWGRLAVVAGGACAAAWMVAERAAHGARPAGPFGNPNGSATAALLGLALAPSLRLPLGARVPLMALAAAGVVASGSRGALIGACVVAVAWGFAGRRRRGLALAAGLIAAVAVLGLALRFVRDRDPLRYERLRIWGVVARVAAAELPFGCGPGAGAGRGGTRTRRWRTTFPATVSSRASRGFRTSPRATSWRSPHRWGSPGPCSPPDYSRVWPPRCAAAARRRGAWRRRSASPRRSTRSSWCPRWRGWRRWRSAACSTGRARRAAPARAGRRPRR